MTQPVTKLYLIRHGQAMGAIQHIIGDTELSPKGIAQAEHLRDRLAATGEIAADVLIASTLLRARQTAEIIAPALELPIILDRDVEEFRVGELEGLTEEEAEARFGRVNVKEEPFRPLAPGAESWASFMYRVSTALDRITHEYAGKSIVIVCHGGIIDGSFLHFFGMSTTQIPQVHFHTHNTSITCWQKSSFRDLPPEWRLIKYNDDAHVLDLTSETRIPWAAISARVNGQQPSVPVPTEQ